MATKRERGYRVVRAAVVAKASVATIAMIAACSSPASDTAAPVVQTSSASGALSLSFARAAEGAGVPRDLLVAIARVEDGLEMPAQRLDIDEDAAVPAAGPLMLRHGKLDTLARAAALSGKTELELRKNTDVALEAGALVLAELGAKTGARADDITSWKDAIEEMSGYADDAHREEYAHRVFATLARGGTLDARDGETITLPKHDLPPGLTLDISFKLHTLAVAQFPGAQWIPTSCSNKCTPGRAGNKVEYIVIHDTEGGWDASVATLQNDPQKSVQYIVGTDGKVAQFVTEETTAWHAGNFHFNQRSVGIEHVGYSTKPYTEANYAASAKLVDYLAKKYNIARDRAHIIGHDQVPNGTRIAQSSAPCSASPKGCASNLNYGGAGHHTDPGVWEWATYMPRFNGSAKCNDVTSLWNCSNDKKSAFRCAGGNVTVDLCDAPGACEVKPNGQDDVCHSKPASVTPPPDTFEPREPGTAGTPELTAPGSNDEAAPDTTGAPISAGDDLAPPPSASEGAGGCSTSSRPTGGSSGVALGLVLVAGSFIAARRRRG